MGQGTKTDEPGAGLISAKMAKALGNTSRAQIMEELSIRPMSPSQFVEEVGGDLSNISRCFRKLAEWDFVELVEVRKGGRRRGGVEHVYRIVQRPLFDTPTWKLLPGFLQDEITGNLLKNYFKRIDEAIEADTLNAESDRHLSWDAPSFDRQAWTHFVTQLDEVLGQIPELEKEAAKRMAESGEDPIPATIGLACFRSPKVSAVKRGGR